VPGPKTNEREGTRAVLRHSRVSPYKAREVLDLIRGKPVGLAAEILRFSERDVAITIGKLLASAVANAQQNDHQEPDELYVSACFADEGTTIKRWRPRARGRATRIRKRTSHMTIIVSRLPDDQLVRLQGRRQAELTARRARRVAGARKVAAGTTAPGRSRLGRRRGAGADEPGTTPAVIDTTEAFEAALAGEAGTEAAEETAEDRAPDTEVAEETAPDTEVLEAIAEETAAAGEAGTEETAEVAEETAGATPAAGEVAAGNDVEPEAVEDSSSTGDDKKGKS
jgi:large subunit ribosomal protein L22